MRSLDDIRQDFLATMADGQMFSAITAAVQELERSDGHAMTQHDACLLATRWAIDEGYFSEDEEDDVEQLAEQVVSSGRPA